MSSFFRRKAETFFTRIDLDGDGVITKKDFEMLAERLMEDVMIDINRGLELKENLSQIYDSFNKDVTDEQPLTKERYAELAETSYRREDFCDQAMDIFRIYFALIDSDGDGFIQKDEFVKFFGVLWDVNADDARASFQAIDTDQDGTLSLGEYLAAGRDYLVNDDEASPMKYFWGPFE